MIRIALLSDIHFGKFSRTSDFCVPGVPRQDECPENISFKSSLVDLLKEHNVKYIFIAGDLTSEGVPHEFYHCEKSLINIANEANVPVENIVLSLGNHDIDWNITKLYEVYDKDCGKNFPLDVVKKIYKDIAANAPAQSLLQIPKPQEQGPAPFSGVVEYSEFVVFILNSGWCCTHDQTLKHGKLDKTQLAWFEKQATKYKNIDKWKIVLVHHHPAIYAFPVPGVDTSMLEEGPELMDIVGQKNIQLVLHGHRHHPRAQTLYSSSWENPVTSICAGSLAVNAKHRNNGEIPNTLHILELTDTIGILKLYNFKYTSAEGWLPLTNNCPETPLDKFMYLGKIPAQEELSKAILQYKNAASSKISYDDLEECLHFLTFGKLKEKMVDILSGTHDVLGDFPEGIALIKN